MGKTIIEIKDLRREFKMGGETLHVLKGIDLNIYEGEFVTIMGPSGSQSAPMNLLFDEAGKFLAGRILSEAEASAQVELDSGKRVKVKTAS